MSRIDSDMKNIVAPVEFETSAETKGSESVIQPIQTNTDSVISVSKKPLSTLEIFQNIDDNFRRIGIPTTSSEEWKHTFQSLIAEIAEDPDSLLLSPIMKYVEEISQKTAADDYGERDILLGELLYVLDNHFTDTLEKIDPDDMKTSTDWIHAQTKVDLESARADLIKERDDLERLQDRNPVNAFYIQQSLAISKLLLLRNGQFNSSFVPLVMNTFNISLNDTSSQNQNFKYTLKKLASSTHLKQQLANVKAPQKKGNPSHLVICTLLGISTSNKVSNLQAQQVVLSALLSPLRQKNEGSCFATSITIQLKLSDLNKCITDLSDLIQFGYLSRKTDQVTRQFPFFIQPNEKVLKTPIPCQPDGKLLGQADGYIWEIPSITSACLALGLENVKDEILQILDPNKNEITPMEILSSLASKEKSRMLNFQFAAAVYSTHGRHLLVDSWNNVIAGMAEATSEGLIMSTILSTVRNILSMKLHEIFRESSAISEKILIKFMNEFCKRIRLQFDHTLSRNSVKTNGRSNEGAFVLYDTQNRFSPRLWNRVDTPEKFQDMIRKIINNVKEEENLDDQQLQELYQYIDTDNFLLTILSEYENTNFKTPELLRHPEKIKYAPWITYCGNDLKKILKTYYGPDRYQVLTFSNIENAKDLFFTYLEQIQNLSPLMKSELRENPQYRLPIRVKGIHAFSTLQGHPSAKEILDGVEDVKKWVQEKMIVPGKQIAQHLISAKQKQLMMKCCMKNLLSKENCQIFEAEMEQLPENISISQFRTATLDLLMEIGTTKFKSHQLCQQFLDKHIALSLPAELKDKFHSQVFHFADSNWEDQEKNLNFCFLINPGNGELEMWAVSDDNQHFYPLDQHTWFENQEWEFFKINELNQQGENRP